VSARYHLSRETNRSRPIRFQTEPEIALQQMRQALAGGVSPGVVLADPAYGNDSNFRAEITELGLPYAVGIMPSTAVWPPGEAPLPPAPYSGRGRRAKRLRRDEMDRPVSVKTLALELPADAWQKIAWRDGSNTPLTSRFARLRVSVRRTTTTSGMNLRMKSGC
jgi:SRSO17 transposase